MTALFADSVVAVPVRPRAGVRRIGCNAGVPLDSHASSTQVSKATGMLLVARHSSPTAVRYEWTPRGLGVLIASAVLVTGLMGATLVGSFLAVSDAPPVHAGVATELSVRR